MKRGKMHAGGFVMGGFLQITKKGHKKPKFIKRFLGEYAN
jgi:hypothetical protein